MCACPRRDMIREVPALMDRQRRRGSGHRIGPGASTVLMILLVLCLTMLGVLSLAAARSDSAITQRAVQAETAYYQAQTAAAEALAELDAALVQVREEVGGDLPAWEDAIARMAGYRAERGDIALEIPVDDHRLLSIVVEPLPPEEGRRYDVVENRIMIIPEEIEW